MTPTLEVSLTLDRATYAPGDTATATLAVTNRGAAGMTLEFGTGQRYDFELYGANGARMWRWSDWRGFIQMIGQETLEPGKELAYRERIPVPSEPGTYRLAGVITARQFPRAEVALVVQ